MTMSYFKTYTVWKEKSRSFLKQKNGEANEKSRTTEEAVQQEQENFLDFVSEMLQKRKSYENPIPTLLIK